MKAILVCFAFLLCNMVLAQNTITGTITDKTEPIIGATIFNENALQGTTTDDAGNFEIVATEGDLLSINYLGYEETKVTISQERIYPITLLPSSVALDGIVVTALGLERKTKDLGYSVQRLKSKDISDVKAVNFLDNLSGKLAGVTVTQGATGVGSSAKIAIRGEASFTNNNPLFVVDGIPVNNRTNLNVTNELAAGFQEVDFGNGAMDINPDDIASVSVLKGPSAAALYGTRASNGVIVITTKDGSENKGLGINYNSSFFVDQPFALPQFQNTYGQGNSGEFEFVDGLGGGINDNITYSYGPQLDVGNQVAQFDSPVTLPDGSIVRGGDVAVRGGAPITPSPFISYPDNLKNFYETGNTLINNLSVSNSSNMGNYRLSFTDLRSESYIPGVNLNRQTVAGKFGFTPTKRLTINSSFNYVYTQSDNRPSSGYGSENINYSLVAWMGRQTNLESLKDYWQPGLEDVQQYSFNYTFFDNPYLILLENKNGFDRNRIFGNIAVNYELTDKISLMVRTGMDNLGEERTFKRVFSSNRFSEGAYAENNINFREINSDFLLNYSDVFGEINLDVSVGANRLNQIGGSIQTQAIGLAQPGIFNLENAASPLEVSQFNYKKRINSIYGIAKFGFRDFLFVDVTARNDWSSALATPISSENTDFFYPSVSASFILSEIADLPNSISFAKLRASWAQVGNDTDPYQTVGVFSPQTPVAGKATFSDQDFIPNNNLLSETSTAIEVGADVRFFDDALSFDISYYKAKNENQILALPIPISSGYSQQIINGGTINATGLEIIMGAAPIRNRNFNWTTFLNYSTNTATVADLPEGEDAVTLAYSRVYDNPNQTVWFIVEEGGQVGDIWGTGYQKNENGDFIIDEKGELIADNTLQKLGNYNPDFILGFSNQLNYKNFGLNFTFDWRQGGQLVSRTQALAGVAGQLAETENRPEEGLVFPGVTADGAVNTIAINPETYYRQFYDRNHEENNMYDASYLKLRQFQLSYRFTKQRLSNTFLSDLEGITFSIVGRNIFAISEIPHFDPEQIAVQGNTFVSGVEDMSYPTARSFGVSLNVGF